MLWIILGAILIALCYYLITKPLKYWRALGVPQSDPWVLLNDSWQTTWKTIAFPDFIKSVYERCNASGADLRYFGFYQFNKPTLILKDPDLIKQITVKDFDHFTDHFPFIPEDADPLWGRNLFALTGKSWRDMRATLSPSFTSSKMRHMFVLIDEAAQNFVNYFKRLDQSEVEVEFKDIFTRFTNDVIATTAFGIKVDSLTEKNNDFYIMGRRVTDFSGLIQNLKFIGFFFIPGLLKKFQISFFDREVRNFFINLTRETIRVREEQKIVRPDMINLLMEARKGNQKNDEEEVVDTGFATVQETIEARKDVKMSLEDIDIAAQAMIFFFAGFDSVSGLMCTLAYELAINPDVQNRLREEIRETLRQGDGKLTYEALLKMKYMDMVVSESLRKWPNAVQTDRICTKPYTIKATNKNENDLQLAVNSILLIPIYGIHRDPKFYPNPDKFDPERFSDENKAKINPYTYLPFGVGPRNCIGSRFALLETKCVIFHILNNFEIIPNAKSTIPFKVSKKQFNFTAEGGFLFSFKKLDQ